MINKIWNWIKDAVTPHRQKDEHLQIYENKKSFCDNHSKYKHRCPDCQEAVN
jgi:hypothetical protein